MRWGVKADIVNKGAVVPSGAAHAMHAATRADDTRTCTASLARALKAVPTAWPTGRRGSMTQRDLRRRGVTLDDHMRPRPHDECSADELGSTLHAACYHHCHNEYESLAQP